MPSSFEALPISADLARRLREREITEPTPIQEQAIPLISEGIDVIAESQTGTGKTLAYLLPILDKIDVGLKQTQALVLVPTRELGMQIVQEAERLSEGTKRIIQPLIGGASLSRQVDKLRLHPHLVVGTPGRVQELIKLRKLSMHYVKTIVVDEVDQVFDLGSAQEVEIILKSALRDRQILFFSATVTDTIRKTAERWMKEPQTIHIHPEHKVSETLEHLYFVSAAREKIDMLRRLVRTLNPRSAIVFINDTDDVAEVVAKLKFAGLSIEALYGEAGKQERAKVMNGFREGRFQLLLATDVAARGLDIPSVTHVFNLDLPIDADHYVHRAGRTGRMGRRGTVVSLAETRERAILGKFAKALAVPFHEKELYSGRVVSPEENRSVRARRERDPQAPQQPRGASGPAAAGPEAAGAQPEPGRGPAHADRAAKPAGGTAEAAGRSVRPAGPKPGGAAALSARKPTPAAPKARKAERERDRKNKGAPKWLKDKPAKE